MQPFADLGEFLDRTRGGNPALQQIANGRLLQLEVQPKGDVVDDRVGIGLRVRGLRQSQLGDDFGKTGRVDQSQATSGIAERIEDRTPH